MRNAGGWRIGRNLPGAPLAGLVLATMLFSSLGAHAAQAGTALAFLAPQTASHAPSGFKGLCERYAWVCDTPQAGAFADQASLAIAEKVNRAVNRSVAQIDDRSQYGVDELWTLPTARGGDCEDLVLLKKKMLTERGVPARALLIATVLDRRMNSHAVLVLRTAQGDMVLDNLTDRILPWKRTGYTFLKLQNPNAKAQWDAVLAGGIIEDRPTASR